jgi:hypothetical protein
VRSRFGESSERKIAMPRAMGVEIAIARRDEYSVPHMNGSAPKSPDTGSQVFPVQKRKPNFASDRCEVR